MAAPEVAMLDLNLPAPEFAMLDINLTPPEEQEEMHIEEEEVNIDEEQELNMTGGAFVMKFTPTPY